MNEFLPKSWVVDDQGVRIFILAGSEKALIVDSGMTGLNVMGLARKYTNLPLELLNTHADMDHIAGNGSFRMFFMHPGDIGQFESSFGTGFEIVLVRAGNEICNSCGWPVHSGCPAVIGEGVEKRKLFVKCIKKKQYKQI